MSSPPNQPRSLRSLRACPDPANKQANHSALPIQAKQLLASPSGTLKKGLIYH